VTRNCICVELKVYTECCVKLIFNIQNK